MVPGSSRSALALAWLLAAVSVPSAVAAAKWAVVARHPLLSAVLLLLAAFAIAATGLARQVWTSRFNARVVNWIGAVIDRGTTGFGRRYRAYLVDDLRFVDPRGLWLDSSPSWRDQSLRVPGSSTRPPPGACGSWHSAWRPSSTSCPSPSTAAFPGRSRP